MDNKLKTVGAETLLSTPMSKTMFIVDGLISQGVNVISGASKIGKSWLMLWLGVRGPKKVARLFGERRHSGASEFCRLRRNEGYGACDDEVSRLFVLLESKQCLSPMSAPSKRAVRFYSRQGRSTKTLVRACPKTPKEKVMKVRTTQ